MSEKQDCSKVISLWVERNLTRETADGFLSKAFEVDGIIDQITECRCVQDLREGWCHP